MPRGFVEPPFCGEQDAEVARDDVGQSRVAHLARRAERQFELRACFRALASLLVEEAEIAASVAFLSPVADLARQRQRPLVMGARLLELAERMVQAAEVADEAAFVRRSPRAVAIASAFVALASLGEANW